MKICLVQAVCLAIGLAAPGVAARAAPIVQRQLAIPLEPGAVLRQTSSLYRCRPDWNGAPADEAASLRAMLPAGPFRVRYFDTDDIHLAIVPLYGRTHVLTEVVSADGGKYAVDMVSWWTHGREASFAMETDQARATMTCTEQP